jgi:hypothetical protein
MLLGVITRLVGRGKERQTIKAAARSGNAGGADVYTTLERYSLGMLREATRSACRRTAAQQRSLHGASRRNLDSQTHQPVFCQNRHPDLASLGDEKPIVRATRLAAKRGEVGGKGAGARGEFRPHAHMAERAAEPLSRLGRHGNRRFHKGVDLAMIGKRACFRKRETVGPS